MEYPRQKRPRPIKQKRNACYDNGAEPYNAAYNRVVAVDLWLRLIQTGVCCVYFRLHQNVGCVHTCQLPTHRRNQIARFRTIRLYISKIGLNRTQCLRYFINIAHCQSPYTLHIHIPLTIPLVFGFIITTNLLRQFQ